MKRFFKKTETVALCGTLMFNKNYSHHSFKYKTVEK
jgi:hypothetical protein